MRVRGWGGLPGVVPQRLKEGDGVSACPSRPHPPASPLASRSGQGGAEGWPFGHWAGTFLSADEVRQGWRFHPPESSVLGPARARG